MLIGKNPLNEAPEWFLKNIAERPEECSVNVNGAEIKYFIWGDKTKKPLLLLHGYNAHSFWWDHIAPSLTENHCVVGLDFLEWVTVIEEKSILKKFLLMTLRA